MPDVPITYHQDTQLFRDAVRFTAAETGFSERLIEKDYYCSVVLADLAAFGTGLVFKGGTCLSKVYSEFYCLSEDLDFGISTSLNATRSQGSKQVAAIKSHLPSIEKRPGGLRIVDPLRGFNHSTQYGGRLAFSSVVTGQDDFITVEVRVREPILETPVRLTARTLLADPFRKIPAVPAIDVAVLTRREAYAEKLRAALSRRDPAIRDFFDLDQGLSSGHVDIADHELIRLLNQKLSVPDNGSVDVSPEKLELLRGQLTTQLQPVLRSEDLSCFDLDRSFTCITDIATRLDSAVRRPAG